VLGFEMLEFDSDGCLQWSGECCGQRGEPKAVLIGPSGRAFSKDHAMIARDARDPMHGCGNVGVKGGPQSQEPSERFMIFDGNMDRCQMATSIETGQNDSIQAVGFAAFTKLPWDE
jgi:hypothetical protein